MRERGLKHDCLRFSCQAQMSLPMRERGLKQRCTMERGKAPLSLPMRERGLKPADKILELREKNVAPHAGAWIETNESPVQEVTEGSLPMRERGLKRKR